MLHVPAVCAGAQGVRSLLVLTVFRVLTVSRMFSASSKRPCPPVRRVPCAAAAVLRLCSLTGLMRGACRRPRLRRPRVLPDRPTQLVTSAVMLHTRAFVRKIGFLRVHSGDFAGPAHGLLIFLHANDLATSRHSTPSTDEGKTETVSVCYVS